MMSPLVPSWKDRLRNYHNHQHNHHYELNLPWKSLQLVIPHRLRRKIRSKLRSRISPTSSSSSSTSISSLQTSYNPFDTLRSLQRHHWTILDFQYLVLIIIGIFSLCVIETAGPLMKTIISTALLVSLLLPLTRQFFLPFLPVVTWLIFFYACRFIPNEFRLPIWVRLLPTLENVLYGANLSIILSAHKTIVLDLLAWIPYGILHYCLPFVVSILLFAFSPPRTLPIWAKSFGYMNLLAVLTQTLLPCSPPWYEKRYGFTPGSYDVHGNPAGLARIDELLGTDLYKSSFAQSPVVFGAFPSLHSGHAVLHALFLSHAFPRFKPFFISYCAWLWWATMYLEHHYAVDLVGGAAMAISAYHLAKRYFLPRIQEGKVLRWEYDFIEIGEISRKKKGSRSRRKRGWSVVGENGEEYEEYDLATTGSSDIALDGIGLSDSGDEWVVGNSSCFGSGTLTPVVVMDSVEFGEGDGDYREGSNGFREELVKDNVKARREGSMTGTGTGAVPGNGGSAIASDNGRSMSGR